MTPEHAYHLMHVARSWRRLKALLPIERVRQEQWDAWRREAEVSEGCLTYPSEGGTLRRNGGSE